MWSIFCPEYLSTIIWCWHWTLHHPFPHVCYEQGSSVPPQLNRTTAFGAVQKQLGYSGIDTWLQSWFFTMPISLWKHVAKRESSFQTNMTIHKFAGITCSNKHDSSLYKWFGDHLKPETTSFHIYSFLEIAPYDCSDVSAGGLGELPRPKSRQFSVVSLPVSGNSFAQNSPGL